MLRGRYSSSTTFKLPISSEKLFLMSRGAAGGSLNIVQSDDVGDAANVQIVATYRYQSALDHIKVCAINRGEDKRGVGIFVSIWCLFNRTKCSMNTNSRHRNGLGGSMSTSRLLCISRRLPANRLSKSRILKPICLCLPTASRS